MPRATAAALLAFALVVAICDTGCAPAPDPRRDALILLSRGDLRSGIAALEALRDASPKDPRAWIDLGHGYELARRYDDALEAYDRAAEIAPGDPRGPREGGLRAARWGERAAARPRLEEAIRRGDQEPATFHALGLIRLADGDHAGAREAYLRGLSTPRGARDATCVLGLATVALADGDPREALRWYDELARRRPEHADAHLGRAFALANLGRLPDADAAIEEAVSRGADRNDVAKMRAFVARRRSAAGEGGGRRP
jgi:tetratricopeptide (TPR) repeat protein